MTNTERYDKLNIAIRLIHEVEASFPVENRDQMVRPWLGQTLERLASAQFYLSELTRLLTIANKTGAP